MRGGRQGVEPGQRRGEEGQKSRERGELQEPSGQLVFTHLLNVKQFMFRFEVAVQRSNL